MTDRELKPCPFCGSEDVRFPESIGEPTYNACRLCGSMALIAKWNSRPIEDALRAEVEMRGDQVSALMGQVAQYMAEAQTLRAEVKRLRAYHRAVERIKAWCAVQPVPSRPKELEEAEEYVCGAIMDIIREEAARD